MGDAFFSKEGSSVGESAWVDREQDVSDHLLTMNQTITVTAEEHLAQAKELLDVVVGQKLRWHDDDQKAALNEIAAHVLTAQQAMAWEGHWLDAR